MKLKRLTLTRTLSQITGPGSAALWLFCQAAHGQTIPNPSFETDTFANSPGYISVNTAITGWTANLANRIGLNTAAGPFANNGTIPAGNKVALIQSDPGTPTTLSTTISGLTPGTAYRVTFRANARSGNTPNIKIYVDGLAALLSMGAEGLSTAAVTGSNPYWYVAFDFTANAASQVLALVNDATGDQTLLVDDFKIVPSSARWTIESWTWDGDSGVDPAYLYTHAYSFGSGANATLNGIAFTGAGGGNPVVAGRFSTTFLGNVFNNDANNLTIGGDGSAILARDFIYGGNVPAGSYQSIALAGLTPGVEYVTTVFSVGWEDPSVAQRWVTYSMGEDRLTLNQDQYYNNAGIRISYRYLADASGTATIRCAPFVPANLSFHIYGFANREAVSRFAAPTITTQPKSMVVSPDLAVQFTVAASGVPLPAYQWRFNGGNVAGATDASLALPAVTTADAGGYSVVVSNQAGMVTSVVAQLTVGLPLANPSFEVDSFGGWPGYVSANTPITAWASLPNHGLNPMSDGRSPFADNGTIPHGAQVAFMQGDGALSQTVSGLTVGAQYYVHYYENARTGGTAPSLAVQVGGVTVLAAHPVPPVGSGSYYEMSSEAFTASATDLELAFIKSNPAGGDTTALVDNVAIIPVAAGTPPAITLQPKSTTVYLGQAASFSGRALGSLPLTYQWQLNGAPVAGATTAVLALPTVRLADEGNYTLVAANGSGSVTSSVARLALLEAIPSLHNTGLDAAGLPIAGGSIDPFWTLVTNPDGASTDVFVGNAGFPGAWMANSATSKWVGPRANLGDGMAGGDYAYRTTFDLTRRDTNTVIIVGRWASDNWGTPVRLNGTEVSVPPSFNHNAWTTFTLASSNATFLPGVNTLDFVVNNELAGATGLRLEFTQVSARTLPGTAPAIAFPPQGQTVAEGDTVVLNVSATGSLPLAYQWKKNDVNLPGKTDGTLTLTAVTTNDSGAYRVSVSNLWGTALSANATVTVAYRPVPSFFGTGVAADGQLLAAGATDPHYILATSADANYPGPDAIVVNEAWPVAPAGPWLANGPRSKWIAPQADQGTAAGNAEGSYTYQTTFNLTGYDLSKVTVSAGVAADNSISDVLINGVSSGFTAAGFGSLTPFTIPGGMLVAGANTLDIKLTNDPATPNPTALRVDLKALLYLLAPVALHITHDGANVSIAWSPALAGQKLLWAPDVTGPWTEISNAPNPYLTNAGGDKRFYRVAQ